MVSIAKDWLDEDIEEKNETKANIIAGLNLFSAGLAYIINIFMIHNIKNIFCVVEKQGTPFVQKNVTYINRVHVALWIMWLFCGKWSTFGLASIIMISSLIQILKYGCKLQQEVDETL